MILIWGELRCQIQYIFLLNEERFRTPESSKSEMTYSKSTFSPQSMMKSLRLLSCVLNELPIKTAGCLQLTKKQYGNPRECSFRRSKTTDEQIASYLGCPYPKNVRKSCGWLGSCVVHPRQYKDLDDFSRFSMNSMRYPIW